MGAFKNADVISKSADDKVTILIAARNEEEKIHLTIEDILAQDYPAELFELIIADDHSTIGHQRSSTAMPIVG